MIKGKSRGQTSNAIIDIYRDPASSPPDTLTDGGTTVFTDATALLAPATVRAYASDNALWSAWCRTNGHSSLPATPDAVCAFLVHEADTCTATGKPAAAATLSRRLAAISHLHRAAGFQTPTAHPQVRHALKVLRRKLGTRPTQKAALLTDDLRDALARLPHDTLIGKRNKALLLLGFAGAFRRSELVGLDVEDLEEARRGLIVTVRRSKTDQEALGMEKAIPTGRNPDACPVQAVEDWREAAGIASGALFRYVDRYDHVTGLRSHPGLVGRVVKEAAQSLGFDPARYGAHSLRAGLATSAAMEGADDRTIMAMTGHKSREQLDKYVREGRRWKDNAATRAGL